MFGITGHMSIWFRFEEVTPPPPEDTYVTEDGTTPYVTEDGTTPYVPEI